ncbi:XRE family transcriptional regulator [Streptomyces sp. NPDC060194]|uniref:XRE family transcriptional regulator n=1 Tax=Streptomyces sp. NPDC060194 TaxID=3347069 RepID=UPI00365F40BA
MTADERTDRTDLSDLVRDRLRQLDMSIRTLAERCVDPDDPERGPVYGRGTVENLVKGRMAKAPGEAELRALAAALDLPMIALQRAAAAQYLGLISERWTGNRSARALVARIDELDDAEVAEVDQLVEIYVRGRGRRHGASTSSNPG